MFSWSSGDSWLRWKFAIAYYPLKWTVLDVVTPLTTCFMQALWKHNDIRQVPLHISCQQNSSDNVIQYIFQSWRQATSISDLNGKIPIHYCMDHYPFDDSDVIQEMIVAFPESVICSGINRYTPIFYAMCDNCQDVTEVKCISLIITKCHWFYWKIAFAYGMSMCSI